MPWHKDSLARPWPCTSLCASVSPCARPWAGGLVFGDPWGPLSLSSCTPQPVLSPAPGPQGGVCRSLGGAADPPRVLLDCAGTRVCLVRGARKVPRRPPGLSPCQDGSALGHLWPGPRGQPALAGSGHPVPVGAVTGSPPAAAAAPHCAFYSPGPGLPVPAAGQALPGHRGHAWHRPGRAGPVGSEAAGTARACPRAACRHRQRRARVWGASTGRGHRHHRTAQGRPAVPRHLLGSRQGLAGGHRVPVASPWCEGRSGIPVPVRAEAPPAAHPRGLVGVTGLGFPPPEPLPGHS